MLAQFDEGKTMKETLNALLPPEAQEVIEGDKGQSLMSNDTSFGGNASGTASTLQLKGIVLLLLLQRLVVDYLPLTFYRLLPTV